MTITEDACLESRVILKSRFESREFSTLTRVDGQGCSLAELSNPRHSNWPFCVPMRPQTLYFDTTTLLTETDCSRN